MQITLICTDCNAPSDKYPHYGFSVDFKDENDVQYWAEYPNYKAIPFDFKDKEIYSFDCSIKKVTGLFGSIRYKVSRIKNVKKHL